MTLIEQRKRDLSAAAVDYAVVVKWFGVGQATQEQVDAAERLLHVRAEAYAEAKRVERLTGTTRQERLRR